MAYTTIDDPSLHFQTTIYTGNGGADRAVTNGGNSDLQPDWVWIKNRDAADAHMVFDSTRGVTKSIFTDSTAEEVTDGDTLDAFQSDGFRVDADVKVNTNAEKYVAWQWKANGGTTSSNSDGTITSTVQANTDAGFSIVSYTGTGANATVGHGLSVAPEMMIFKNRNATDVWIVYHHGLASDAETDFIILNRTDAKADLATAFNDTAPTSSVFSIGSLADTNRSNSNIIAYCFKSIKGYSRIGIYTGNGSDDGTFVYTGFKPAWVMIKRTNAVGAWEIYDTKRALYGNSPSSKDLQADSTGAENASTIGNGVDILSNGFKPTTSTLYLNGNGSTYIYLAFAERPFVTSTGTPTTAR